MYKSLPGFREFYPEQCYLKNHIFKVWKQSARVFGFEEFDAPVLEPLEIFIEKSGEEIVTQLFSFQDKGGREVTLRPELTPLLARMAAAKAHALPKPIKWFNIGEHFRYERPQKGRLRSFYQLNCDILGEPGPKADAECIALLVHSLNAFGLTDKDYCIRLSDRNLWIYFLNEYKIYEQKSIDALLSIIDKVERLPEEKVLKELEPILKDKTNVFWNHLQAFIKISSVEALEAFFENATEGSNLHNRISTWKQLLDYLRGYGLEEYLKIDLKIVRGLAYYTGFVFEAFQITGKTRSLAGGGRYDSLIKKLGSVDLPAVGFAMGDVTLNNLLSEKGLLPNYINRPDIYIAYEEEALLIKAALKDVQKLRQAGHSVIYSLKNNLPFNKQLKQASQIGTGILLSYEKNSLSEGYIKLKDYSKNKNEFIKKEDLINYITSY